MKYYTGVGSRETPEEILKVMEDLAFNLRETGWILRSGGAEGADTAFEVNSYGSSEIYVVKKGLSKEYIYAPDLTNWEDAMI